MTKIESTKCNKCISSGGGDCATCDPPGTTAQKEPEYIITEELILRYRLDSCIDPHSLDLNETAGKQFRVRKHNPAPDRTFKCNCEPKTKGNDTDPEMCKSCLPDYQRVGCSCLDMHDAAIAAKAREELLVGVIPALGRAIQTDISDNEYVMIEDLKSILDSLRTAPEE